MKNSSLYTYSVVDEGECDSNSWVLIVHIETVQASIELGKLESNL